MNLPNIKILTCLKLIVVNVLIILQFIFFTSHIYAVTPGQVISWGWNGNGQLGQGTIRDDSFFPPLSINNLDNIIAIDAATHSLSLKSDGSVWSWGENSYGQLGDGTLINNPTPTRVKDPNDKTGYLSNIIDISTSTYNSLALKSDGTVFIWGYYVIGESNMFPKKIIGPDGNDLKNITAIAGTNLALRSDGTVWEWGNYESASASTYKAVQVKGENGDGELNGVIAISSGENHNLALKSDGTVWAWGYNWYGQLGNGFIDYEYHYPVRVKNLTSIESIASGSVHNIALKSDGSIWSWGLNNSGQLGIGLNADNIYDLPTRVKDFKGTGFLSDVNYISAKGNESIAITKVGTVWIWGANPKQEMAEDYTSTFTYLPLEIPELKGAIKAKSGGYGHSLALVPPPPTAPCTLPNFGDDNGNAIMQKDNGWGKLPYGGGFYIKPDGTRVFLPFKYYGNNKDNIGAWGCKLTSAVMIINYFAKEQSVIDPTTGKIFKTTPKILNAWLQQQDNGKGYFNGKALPVGDPKYWDTAFVNFPPIIKYAKSNGVQLSYDQTLFTSNTTKQRVNDSLCSLNPVILAVNDSGHFINATGKAVNNDIDTWKIHDPLWNGTLPGTSTLQSSYHNIYSRVDFLSGNHPKRHLSIAKFSPIEMYITDPLNRKLGFDETSKIKYEDIPNASYGQEKLASSDDLGGVIEYGILDIPDPVDGHYVLTITGTDNGLYGLEFRASDDDSNTTSNSLSGYAIKGLSEKYFIQFTSNAIEPPTITKEVTIDFLKSELKSLYEQHLINNQGIFNSLLVKLEEQNPDSIKKFINELNAQRGKHVTEEAFQKLKNDLDILN